MKVKVTKTRSVDGMYTFFPGDVEVKDARVAKKLQALEAADVEGATDELEVEEDLGIQTEVTEAESKSKSKSRK